MPIYLSQSMCVEIDWCAPHFTCEPSLIMKGPKRRKSHLTFIRLAQKGESMREA